MVRGIRTSEFWLFMVVFIFLFVAKYNFHISNEEFFRFATVLASVYGTLRTLYKIFLLKAVVSIEGGEKTGTADEGSEADSGEGLYY